jgi:hypothetical protein
MRHASFGRSRRGSRHVAEPPVRRRSRHEPRGAVAHRRVAALVWERPALRRVPDEPVTPLGVTSRRWPVHPNRGSACAGTAAAQPGLRSDICPVISSATRPRSATSRLLGGRNERARSPGHSAAICPLGSSEASTPIAVTIDAVGSPWVAEIYRSVIPPSRGYRAVAGSHMPSDPMFSPMLLML